MSSDYFWHNIRKYESFQGVETPITPVQLHFLTVHIKYIE